MGPDFEDHEIETSLLRQRKGPNGRRLTRQPQIFTATGTNFEIFLKRVLQAQRVLKAKGFALFEGAGGVWPLDTLDEELLDSAPPPESAGASDP